MQIIKNGALLDDAWRLARHADELPEGGRPEGPTLVTPALWAETEAALIAGGWPLGLVLEPDQDLDALPENLERFSVIALSFPRFADGRPFSLARRLRGRLGYAGELRALGPILPDQYAFLVRCGCDSVAPERPGDPAVWRRALASIGQVYQVAADRRPSLAWLRHRPEESALAANWAY